MRKKHFTKQIGLIISEEVYNQVVQQTDRKEVTVSEWVREAIQTKLSEGLDLNLKTSEPPNNNL